MQSLRTIDVKVKQNRLNNMTLNGTQQTNSKGSEVIKSIFVFCPDAWPDDDFSHDKDRD